VQITVTSLTAGSVPFLPREQLR